MSTSTKSAPSTPVPYQENEAYQTRPWTEPITATWNTTGSAVCPLTASSVGYFLVVANGFGFAIPTDAIINGIVVEISCREGTGSTTDGEVVLVKAGTRLLTSRAIGDTWPTGSFTYKSHGGASDLWGTSWTPAQINASDFGTAVSAQGGVGDAEINGVRITVYYTTSNVKAVNGLARASIKTKNFVDLSNIKTFNGLQ